MLLLYNAFKNYYFLKIFYRYVVNKYITMWREGERVIVIKHFSSKFGILELINNLRDCYI